MFRIICTYLRHPYDKIFMTELVFKACSCAADNKLSVFRLKFYLRATAMVFLIFYCLFQTDHAVSYFFIGAFFVLFCCCSPFYFQICIFLIFQTLPQLSVTLSHYYYYYYYYLYYYYYYCYYYYY